MLTILKSNRTCFLKNLFSSDYFQHLFEKLTTNVGLSNRRQFSRERVIRESVDTVNNSGGKEAGGKRGDKHENFEACCCHPTFWDSPKITR